MVDVIRPDPKAVEAIERFIEINREMALIGRQHRLSFMEYLKLNSLRTEMEELEWALK